MQDPVGTHTTRGAAAMRALGRALAGQLAPGDVVLLHGDLGAGKTTLTQGLAAGLGVDEVVQSPTFTLKTEHPVTFGDGTPGTLFHLDLYRLTDPDELATLDWEGAIAPERAVTVVEWPERAGDWLPERFLLVSITWMDAATREVTMRCVPDDRDAGAPVTTER